MSSVLREHAVRWWSAAPGSAERSLISAMAVRLNWLPADWRAALAETAPAGPRRIQLRRTPGWRLLPGARSVARPTRWGNPFALTRLITRGDPLRPFLDAVVLETTGVDASEYAAISAATPAVAVAAYRLYLDAHPELRRRAAAELAGLDLGCWCPADQPCHADVLLEASHG